MELMQHNPFAKGFPVLQECFGCGKLYALNHHCEAENVQCNVCQQSGHLSGFCENWKHFKHAPIVPRNTDPNPDTERVPKRARIAPETITETRVTRSEPNIARSSDAGKRKRHKSSNETEDIKVFVQASSSDGKPNDEANVCDVEHEKLQAKLDHYKQVIDSMQERNISLHKSNEELKEKNGELQKEIENERKASDKYQARLRMYMNVPLAETLDHLKDRNEKLRTRAKRCEEDRNKLYSYLKKVEKSLNEVNTRVSCMTKEYYTIADHLYENYPVHTLPVWYTQCKSCASNNLHHTDDCIAKGNVCGYCKKPNHFTAVCLRKRSVGLVPDTGEIAALQSLEKEPYTDDGLGPVMVEFETNTVPLLLPAD